MSRSQIIALIRQDELRRYREGAIAAQRPAPTSK